MAWSVVAELYRAITSTSSRPAANSLSPTVLPTTELLIESFFMMASVSTVTASSIDESLLAEAPPSIAGESLVLGLPREERARAIVVVVVVVLVVATAAVVLLGLLEMGRFGSATSDIVTTPDNFSRSALEPRFLCFADWGRFGETSGADCSLVSLGVAIPLDIFAALSSWLRLKLTLRTGPSARVGEPSTKCFSVDLFSNEFKASRFVRSFALSIRASGCSC